MEYVLNELTIKTSISKYRKITTFILSIFISLFALANWYLINQTADKRFELGLPQESMDVGFVWGGVIMGLLMVLHLSLFTLEKVLVELFTKNRSV